jgi:NAD(P)-dependent dehydrogenase (short-subunit alcohol dehydrogenase family)
VEDSSTVLQQRIPPMKKSKSRSFYHRAGPKLIAVAAIFLASAACAQSDSGKDNSTATGMGTVLVTGANRGIGLELARQYLADGWQVIGTARRPDAATELSGLGAQVMQLDVTDQVSVERLAKELDGKSIDMLINNAGILPMARSISDVNFEDFDRTIAVNTVGPVRVTQALLPNLRAGKGRTVINITSNLGSIAENRNGGFYGYRESKAALNMFTKSLSAELRSEGFICIVMHPGWVQTDMGGSSAPVPVTKSVAGIRRVIEHLTPADNGTFWTHDGEQMPW